MSSDRKSIITLLHLPKEFGYMLLVLTLLLALSPSLGGADFGIFKVPEFTEQVTSKLTYFGLPLFIISLVLHIPLWKQNKNSNRQVIDAASEEAICQKAEAEFQMFTRRFNVSPISQAQHAKIDQLIKETYCPSHVLVSSRTIRIEHYILPLVSELIKIESDLRSKHHVPFSQARIAVLKNKIRTLVNQNWSYVTNAAYEDAINHVIHHQNSLPRYKEIELDDLRNRLLDETPNELFTIIDELLQKALADSILVARVDNAKAEKDK